MLDFTTNFDPVEPFTGASHFYKMLGVKPSYWVICYADSVGDSGNCKICPWGTDKIGTCSTEAQDLDFSTDIQAAGTSQARPQIGLSRIGTSGDYVLAFTDDTATNDELTVELFRRNGVTIDSPTSSSSVLLGSYQGNAGATAYMGESGNLRNWLVAFERQSSHLLHYAGCRYDSTDFNSGIAGCTVIDSGQDLRVHNIAQIDDNLAISFWGDDNINGGAFIQKVELTNPASDWTPNVGSAVTINSGATVVDGNVCGDPTNSPGRFVVVYDQGDPKIRAGRSTGAFTNPPKIGSSAALTTGSGPTEFMQCEFVSKNKIAVFWIDNDSLDNGMLALCEGDWDTDPNSPTITCSGRESAVQQDMDSSLQEGFSIAIAGDYGTNDVDGAIYYVDGAAGDTFIKYFKAHPVAKEARLALTGFEMNAVPNFFSTSGTVALVNPGLQADPDLNNTNEYALSIVHDPNEMTPRYLEFDSPTAFEMSSHFTLRYTEVAGDTVERDPIVIYENRDVAGNRQCFAVWYPQFRQIFVYYQKIDTICSAAYNDGTPCETASVDQDCSGEEGAALLCVDNWFGSSESFNDGDVKEVTITQKTDFTTEPGQVECGLSVNGRDRGTSTRRVGVCDKPITRPDGTYTFACDNDTFCQGWDPNALCDASGVLGATELVRIGRTDTLDPNGNSNSVHTSIMTKAIDDVVIAGDRDVDLSRLYIEKVFPGCDLSIGCTEEESTPQEWQVGAATCATDKHVECLDETTLPIGDEDTTYLVSSNHNELDVYELGNLDIGPGESVGSMALSAVGKQSTAASDNWKTLQLGIRDPNGTDLRGKLIDLSAGGGTAYAREGYTVFGTAPDGGAWDIKRFNNMRVLLYHAPSGNGSADIAVTQMFAEVEVNRPPLTTLRTLKDVNNDNQITIGWISDSRIIGQSFASLLVGQIEQPDNIYHCARGGAGVGAFMRDNSLSRVMDGESARRGTCNDTREFCLVDTDCPGSTCNLASIEDIVCINFKGQVNKKVDYLFIDSIGGNDIRHFAPKHGYCFMNDPNHAKHGVRCQYVGGAREESRTGKPSFQRKLCTQGAQFNDPNNQCNHRVVTKQCWGGTDPNDWISCSGDGDCAAGLVCAWGHKSNCTGEPSWAMRPLNLLLRNDPGPPTFYEHWDHFHQRNPWCVEGDSVASPDCPGLCWAANVDRYVTNTHEAMADVGQARNTDLDPNNDIRMIWLASPTVGDNEARDGIRGGGYLNMIQHFELTYAWIVRFVTGRGYDYIDLEAALVAQCEGDHENCQNDNAHYSSGPDNLNDREVGITGFQAVANAMERCLEADPNAWGSCTNDITVDNSYLFLDDFNRANGGLGADWTLVNGCTNVAPPNTYTSLQIDTNRAKALNDGSSSIDNACVLHTTQSNTVDQFAFIKLLDMKDGSHITSSGGFVFRADGDSALGPHYRIEVENGGTVRWRKWTGTTTFNGEIANASIGAFQPRDRIGAAIQGTGNTTWMRVWRFTEDEDIGLTPDTWGTEDVLWTTDPNGLTVDSGKYFGWRQHGWSTGTLNQWVDNFVGGDVRFPVVLPDFAQACVLSRSDVAATSHTVNYPAGMTNGNVLVVFFAADGNPTITPDTECNTTTNLLGQISTTGGDATGTVSYCTVAGTEGASGTWTLSASEEFVALACELTNAETTAETEPSAVQVIGSSNGITPAPGQPFGRNCMILGFMYRDGRGSEVASGTFAGGYSPKINEGSTDGASADISAAVGYRHGNTTSLPQVTHTNLFNAGPSNKNGVGRAITICTP